MIVQQRETARNEREATNSTRDALVQAVADMMATAPVDARTGDIYFPALHLYLPYVKGQDTLEDYIYQRDVYGDAQAESVISVNTRQTVSGASGDLYNARTPDELFKKVPRVQSCARGVSIATRPIKNLDQGSDQLRRKFHHTQVLEDGRELYFYYEPACSELAAVADRLKELRSY